MRAPCKRVTAIDRLRLDHVVGLPCLLFPPSKTQRANLPDRIREALAFFIPSPIMAPTAFATANQSGDTVLALRTPRRTKDLQLFLHY